VPLDTEVILTAAGECSLLVTVEDHFKTGGLFTTLAELFLCNGLTAPVHPIAMDGRWFNPATLERVLEYEGFTGSQLARRITQVLEEQQRTAPQESSLSLFKTYL
jgi:transketolase